MRLKDTVKTSLRGLTSHKTRSVLTMLGIIIGIASVIMMMSLGKGAEGLILGQLSSFGPQTLFIRPGGGNPSGGPPNQSQQQALKYSDYQAIIKLPSVAEATPILMVSGTVSYQENSSVPQILATTPESFDLNNIDVAEGRLFDSTDVEGATRVVVLGYKVAQDLFNGSDALGKTISIKRQDFTVIGVLPYRGASLLSDLDNSVYLPITTAQRSLSGVNNVNYIMVKAKGDVDLAADDIRFLLRDRHKIDNPTADTRFDDFLVMTQVQALNTFGAVSTALTLFLSAIASISLVVGGIGIMNIMLVSVTERTREIGLRKAVGASQGDIQAQFLIEATALTTLGGAIGIAIGIGISFLASLIIAGFTSDWRFVVPVSAVLWAFGVASLVGVVFGFYPARKAARLDAIEALRYE
jgi:putative ABC transport system permease protein